MAMNYGIEFENEFINSINNKKFKELSENLRRILNIIFPALSDNDLIVAEHCDPSGKPDVKISVNNESHYISLKTNTAKHIHSEELEKFIGKLEDFEISKTSIDTIKKFHFGDGTTDGSGINRMTYDELFPIMINDIKNANEELNSYNEKVVKLVEKFVFIGNNASIPEADFIYHGSINFGVLCSRKQIVKHLRRRNYDYMRNLHIGPLQFHPYARYANFKERNPYKRKIINFVWVNFVQDLEYISSHYPFYWDCLYSLF